MVGHDLVVARLGDVEGHHSAGDAAGRHGHRRLGERRAAVEYVGIGERRDAALERSRQLGQHVVIRRFRHRLGRSDVLGNLQLGCLVAGIQRHVDVSGVSTEAVHVRRHVTGRFQSEIHGHRLVERVLRIIHAEPRGRDAVGERERGRSRVVVSLIRLARHAPVGDRRVGRQRRRGLAVVDHIVIGRTHVVVVPRGSERAGVLYPVQIGVEVPAGGVHRPVGGTGQENVPFAAVLAHPVLPDVALAGVRGRRHGGIGRVEEYAAYRRRDAGRGICRHRQRTAVDVTAVTAERIAGIGTIGHDLVLSGRLHVERHVPADHQVVVRPERDGDGRQRRAGRAAVVRVDVVALKRLGQLRGELRLHRIGVGGRYVVLRDRLGREYRLLVVAGIQRHRHGGRAGILTVRIGVHGHVPGRFCGEVDRNRLVLYVARVVHPEVRVLSVGIEKRRVPHIVMPL